MWRRDITVEAILFSYVANKIDFNLHCMHNPIDFGKSLNPPEPQFNIGLKDSAGDDIQVPGIVFIMRTGGANAPTIEKEQVVCSLSFGGCFRNVIIPHSAIVGISLIDTEFGLSIPLELIPASSKDVIPEATPTKVATIKSKKKSYLTLVK